MLIAYILGFVMMLVFTNVAITMKSVARRDLPNLNARHAVFVIEYMKDFAPRRAAEAAGFTPENGYTLLKDQNIINAIDTLMERMLDEVMISADDIIGELWDNHRIARQMGNIPASNAALGLLCRHKRVDAFAADKIKVTTDADVVDRLNAGRARAAKANDDINKDKDFY